MPTIINPYRPTPKQLLFHQSTAREILYGGAAGGGKSRALVEDAFARCMIYPGFRAFMFRRTYPELEQTLIAEAKAIIPEELAKYNSTRHEYAFPNKSSILFRHCEDDADKNKYYGAEIHGLYIDELTTFTQPIYDFLKSRVRTKKELRIPAVIRCGSNPGNIGHGWVKQYFVTSAPYGEIHKEKVWSEELKKYKYTTIQYIPAKAIDNPHIGENYIMELERKPAALKRALLHGDWDAFEGQVFMEFKDDPRHYRDGQNTHVISPIEIPHHWTHYRTFDWGFTKPFAVGWFAVAPSGTSYCYREWYGSNGEPDVGLQYDAGRIAAGIREREIDEIQNGVQIMGLADPSIFDASRGVSIAEQMRREGVVFSPADNARISGKQAVHSKLAFDKDGYPGLYFFNTCKHLIRTLPSLPYATTGDVEDIDTKAEDHCLIGSTLVWTDKGKIPIAQMQKSGRVLSSDGTYHAYCDCRKTQTNVDVFTVTLEDGTTITATKNHRFMLSDGTWKRLCELLEGDDVKCVSR